MFLEKRVRANVFNIQSSDANVAGLCLQTRGLMIWGTGSKQG